MKRLTLDQTWKLCLSMWRWIAKMWRQGTKLTIGDLKDQWLKKHKYQNNIVTGCFFCDYANRHGNKHCKISCPGAKVDKTFNCENKDYNYRHKPIAFYKKLVSLNRKRLAKKK